jgi:hypothetical protein
MLGAGPLIGLDQFFAKNGPDLSNMLLYKNPYIYLNSLIPVSAILVKYQRNFFPLNCQEMLGACPLIGLDRLLAKNGDFSQISKEFCFPRNCQEMLGAGPLIGLDRFFAKNGPDFSQYATL